MPFQRCHRTSRGQGRKYGLLLLMLTPKHGGADLFVDSIEGMCCVMKYNQGYSYYNINIFFTTEWCKVTKYFYLSRLLK